MYNIPIRIGRLRPRKERLLATVAGRIARVRPWRSRLRLLSHLLGRRNHRRRRLGNRCSRRVRRGQNRVIRRLRYPLVSIRLLRLLSCLLPERHARRAHCQRCDRQFREIYPLHSKNPPRARPKLSNTFDTNPAGKLPLETAQGQTFGPFITFKVNFVSAPAPRFRPASTPLRHHPRQESE